jgi:hypothetical protein
MPTDESSHINKIDFLEFEEEEEFDHAGHRLVGRL